MRFKNMFSGLIALAIMLLACIPVMAQSEDMTADEANNILTYQAHVQNIGWMDPVSANVLAGTEGQSLSIESLIINLPNISYNAHVKNIGWQTPVASGEVIGTTGQALPIEAIQISKENLNNIDLYYRVHVANIGWLDWAKNGETAGTTGCALPIEAIEIVAVPVDSAAPGDTTNSCIDKSQFNLSLSTHVSNLGWTESVNGGVSGTTGQSLPVEAIDLQVNDPLGTSAIVGQAYVSGSGWQDWSAPNTAIGTTGQALSVEAINYQLVGPAASIYDLNYRVHVKNVGWMPWTVNGKPAGQLNANTPIEAVDIVLQPKGYGADQAGAYKVVETPADIQPTAPDCIVINIGKQQMVYYENYDIKVNTNVVTGMAGIDDTKIGDWKVEEKLSPYRTKGPGYDAVVSYWLTLYIGDIYGFSGEGHIVDRVGIHDASWRTDWGSSAYLYNGSHGCVNTPFAPMQYIFQNCSVGDPVIIR